MVERVVDVVVVGAGVVGLGIAWTLIRSGRSVAVVDPAPATGATFAAAGMLAPVSELHFDDPHFLELTGVSAALYPAFVDSLETTATGGADGLTVGYQRAPTITVGVDAADRRALGDLHRLQLEHDLPVRSTSIREARTVEPMLSSRLSAAFINERDAHLDPRRLADALMTAIARHSAHKNGGHSDMIREDVAELLHASSSDMSSAITGVVLADGSTIRSGEVIVANACAASQLRGLPKWLKLSLRPVYGDILRLGVPQHLRPLLQTTVRGVVHGSPLYLVPRSDDTLVLGATQRERGSVAVSAGGTYELLRDAQLIVPAVNELDIIEITARARPTTPDNAPLIGRVRTVNAKEGDDIPGLIIATGFYRHGVLLTPIAGQICAQLLAKTTDARWSRYRPDRFSFARPEEAHSV